jgi:iron-sulfur cluster repair protein YtfE (RIC family)
MTLAFTNRVSQTLHDEHCSNVALMERLERIIAHHRHGPPDPADRAVAQLLSDLPASLEVEVRRHFAFEEERLFPYLAAVGAAAIGEHLTEDHAAIHPLGVRIAALARDAAARGFDAASWEEFCRSGRELCERMLAHVQKEEMALLPLVEDTMDAEIAAQLLQDYLESV